MNSAEFVDFLDDLKRKSPLLAEWVKSLPDATIAEWISEVFSRINLRDAKVVNREIRDGVHDLSGYRRDEFCRTYIRRCAELTHAREEKSAEQKWQEAKRGTPSFATIERDRVMGPAFRKVRAKMAEWSQSHPGERVPAELIHQWTEDVFADAADDDPERQPRYRCLTCRDTGYASGRDAQQRPLAYACSCDKGQARKASWDARMRSVIGNHNTFSESQT